MAPISPLQGAQLASLFGQLGSGFSGGTNVLAQNIQRQAAATIQQELVRKARKEQDKAKKSGRGKQIGSALGAIAGIAAAPFTGGLSLAATGALVGGLTAAGGLAGKAAAGGKLTGRDLLEAQAVTALGAATGVLGGAVAGAGAGAAGGLAATAAPSFGGPFSAVGGVVTAAPLGVAGPIGGGLAGISTVGTGGLSSSLAASGSLAGAQLASSFRPEGGGAGEVQAIPFGANPTPAQGSIGSLPGLPGRVSQLPAIPKIPPISSTPAITNVAGSIEGVTNPANQRAATLTNKRRILQQLQTQFGLNDLGGGNFPLNTFNRGRGVLGELFGNASNAPLRLGGTVVGLDPQQRAQVVQELERENVRVEEARVQERQDLTAIQERQKDRALRISVAQTDIKAKKDIELLRQEGFDTRALEGREARAEGAAQTQEGLFERQQIGIEATKEAAALRTEAQLGKAPKPTVAQKRIIDEIDEVEKDARQLEQFGISREGIFDTAETAQQLRVLRSRQQELRNLLIQSGGEAFLMAPEDRQKAGALSLRLDPTTGNIIFNPPDGSAGIPITQKLTPLIR